MKFLFIHVILISLSANGQQINSESVQNKINYDSIKIVLESIYDSDQGIRKILDSVGFNSPEAKTIMGKMWRIQKINQPIVLNILDRYGWLPMSKIGEKASDAIFYVIQHSDNQIMPKYFPMLQVAASIGEAKKTDEALMEDRLLMWTGKKQKYGTQSNSSLRKDGSFAIWPIENPSVVDSLRKAAGFTLTVRENAKRLNAEYDPNEKLPIK